MTKHTLNRVRYVAAALAVVGLLVVEGRVGSPIAAAGLVPMPDCDGFCGPEADCASGCVLREGEQVEEITCGEYNGGADNDQCNTCDYVCGVWSPPTQMCWMGGNETDCQADGPAYAECGDGVCQNGTGGEGCDSCAEDCEACPEIECGDFVCDPGETYVTCATDCTDPGSGGFCGDGVCSEDDQEDYTNCQKDCATPNERCDDAYDCGSGYTCIPGGEPYGGRCVLFEQVLTFDGCSTDLQCDTGFVCVQVQLVPDPNESQGRCLWFWEAYTR